MKGEAPVLDDQAASKDDIIHECGLGSFPASDPPSWWAAGSVSNDPASCPGTQRPLHITSWSRI